MPSYQVSGYDGAGRYAKVDLESESLEAAVAIAEGRGMLADRVRCMRSYRYYRRAGSEWKEEQVSGARSMRRKVEDNSGLYFLAGLLIPLAGIIIGAIRLANGKNGAPAAFAGALVGGLLYGLVFVFAF